MKASPGKIDLLQGNCVFCQLALERVGSLIVFEDEQTLGFLDNKPLFPGHCLLIPKAHHATLCDLPPHMLGPLFSAVQKLGRAVEAGMQAAGTFVAINNRVSQSVPHLHVHIVPRRKNDGLKGFFWPRNPYESREAGVAAQQAIISALETL